MSECYILSAHIEKLGHNLLEIRERALFNLVSKLNNGLLFDNDLARSKDLITKLLKWFLFEPTTNEAVVLKLLKRILQSESGRILINHYGEDCGIIQELNKIKSYIEPKFHPCLDDLLGIANEVLSKKPPHIVPPLVSDKPLSYRSDEDSFANVNYSPLVGTTATPIEGYVYTNSSRVPQMGADIASIKSAQQLTAEKRVALQWQPLIETDRHVLQSVENSLVNPTQPAALMHSCEFFNNVLLHDFPGEIFLQRPTIILQFFHLVKTCRSTRITKSVLHCLFNLTKTLQTRVNHCNDPNMTNSKLEHLQDFTYNNESNRSAECDHFESNRDKAILMSAQISVPKFVCEIIICICDYLTTSSRDKEKIQSNQKGINLALSLLNEALKLLYSTISLDVFDQTLQNNSLNILKELNEVFVAFGDILEHFRIEASGSDEGLNSRLIYLYLLHNCASLLPNLVPQKMTKLILPKNFKTALTNSLLDNCLARMYPKVHGTLYDYVHSFSVDEGINLLQNYNEVQKICDSIKAAIAFLKNHRKYKHYDLILLAKQAWPCLEFHEDLNFIQVYIEACSKSLMHFKEEAKIICTSEEITLRLLSHSSLKVRLETYRTIHKIIAKLISSEMPESRIYFLLTDKILTEIALHGLNDKHLNKYAEDILIHIIKSQILVSSELWQKIIEALIPVLPILACNAEKATLLGRTVISILDPDTAKNMLLPEIVIVRCNILFMFAHDVTIREEAFSRLTWLLAKQPKSRELLPRLNDYLPHHKVAANLCYRQKNPIVMVNVNKSRVSQHLFQPSNIYVIADVLASEDVEPEILQAALKQLTFILEDPLTHQYFIDTGGLNLLANIVEKVITYQPHSLISIITAMKQLCFYHAPIRQELSGNAEVIYSVLRALFMFFDNDRMKTDASSLLFMLVFKDYFTGNPSNGNLSIVHLISEKLQMPFSCNTHSKISLYSSFNLKDALIKDKWCLNSIQIQWNCELFGDFTTLLKQEIITYSENDKIQTPELLKLSQDSLDCLRASSVEFCVEKYLSSIQNGTSHETVIESIEKLTLCLYVHLFPTESINGALLNFEWEQSFGRFLKSLPSCEEDVLLLRKVVQFLQLLVVCYKKSDKCWITKMLKDHNLFLLDLLDVDQSTDEETKLLCQDLLGLITIAACQEHQFLDYYAIEKSEEKLSWLHVIRIIADNLQFSDAQHFYNLAYLDSLLLCLVHLTSSLRWSNSKIGSPLKEPIPQLISGLCELVNAFHCGKGTSAAISVMGLSITRHVVLILNHLLSELLNAKAKGWEMYFLKDEEDNFLNSFVALWGSRDVVLRAASLQLVAGIASSPRGTTELINIAGIYDRVLSIIVDHNEAGIVRENAANLFGNLIDNINLNPGQKNDEVILNLFDAFDFFNNLDIMFNSLFLLKPAVLNKNVYFSEPTSSTSSASNYDSSTRITTPAFIKSVATLLAKLHQLAPDFIAAKLQERGLMKLLFRALFVPILSIANTKEVALYCDILEMNTMVCYILNKLVLSNSICHGTVLHTRDCLNVLVQLLNAKVYETNLPQLIYLRNKLWSEIFYLIASLMEFKIYNHKSLEALDIFVETLSDVGCEGFIETLCEALSCIGSHYLQNSALICLTNVLKIESYRTKEICASPPPSNSMQSFLDTFKSSKSIIINKVPNNKENVPITTYNGLEKVYMDKLSPKSIENIDVSFTENSQNLTSGAEICKILLNLYDLCNLKSTKNTIFIFKYKSNVTASISSILCVSTTAKKFALKQGLLPIILEQLKEFVIKLSLESVESWRRVSDKKRISAILKDLNEVIGLLINFLLDNAKVKSAAAAENLADILHKLWVWFQIQNNWLKDVLELLCVFTSGCSLACQTLPLTNAVAGAGPRRSPSNISLLHAIIAIVNKEMEQTSKTHDLANLKLCFNILHNCIEFLECRMIVTKSNILQSILRLHPAITKRQKSWESVELIWLEFLQDYTTYPEGQTAVAKLADVLDLILTMTSSSKPENSTSALFVLRNLAFYQPNKSRLLASGDFLYILQNKLANGNAEEKNTVVVIMWALSANSQKAKIVLKSAQLDVKLQDAIKHYQLCESRIDGDEDLQRMYFVLNILREF